MLDERGASGRAKVEQVAVHSGARRVPRLRGAPLVGSLRDIRRDYLGTISRAAEEVGALARITAGPPGWRITIYSVSSPSLAAEILGQPDRYRKNAPGYRELRGALGDSLLTSQDEAWHRQRRLIAHAFTAHRIDGRYAEIMTDEAQRVVARWGDAADQATTLDAYPEMIEVTSKVIGRILFGADMSQALGQLRRFRRINDELLRRAVRPHALPTWLPTPANRRLNADLAALRGVVADIIAARRALPADRHEDDLLSLLLTSEDPIRPGDHLSDTEITDQILLFLVAGFDTTAFTLACTLVQLALAPVWQTRVRDELGSELGGRAVGAADVTRLPWAGRVIRECMRLYPPAHGMARSTVRDEVLDGCLIPAGSWVEVSPWGVHHSPAVWPDPGTFDPRRFDVATGQVPGGHRHAWFPFGAGPRACIGMQLALLEVNIVLGTILQHFRLTTPLSSIPVHAAITLQPTGALPIRLERLHTPSSVLGVRDRDTP